MWYCYSATYRHGSAGPYFSRWILETCRPSWDLQLLRHVSFSVNTMWFRLYLSQYLTQTRHLGCRYLNFKTLCPDLTLEFIDLGFEATHQPYPWKSSSWRSPGSRRTCCLIPVYCLRCPLNFEAFDYCFSKDLLKNQLNTAHSWVLGFRGRCWFYRLGFGPCPDENQASTYDWQIQIGSAKLAAFGPSNLRSFVCWCCSWLALPAPNSFSLFTHPFLGLDRFVSQKVARYAGCQP